MPSPVPKPPRVRGVRSLLKSPAQTVTINPKLAAPNVAPPPLTSFSLTPVGPGKLLLKYHSGNSELEFNARAPFVIQLDSTDPLKVEPSVITRENWPKNATEMTLTYSGVNRGTDNVIFGKAAYTVCERKSKECHSTKVPIELHLK